MRLKPPRCLCLLLWVCLVNHAFAATFSAGLARIDVTPTYPIRLSGYAVRTNESEGIAHHIFVRAIAIKQDGADPAVAVSVDNCGLSKAITDEVSVRIWGKKRIPRERLVFFSTHTHSAPCLDGVLPNMFAQPVPEPHREHLKRYTAELKDALEKVVLDAVADLRPAEMRWAEGRVGFARNRRPQGGPVDHALPILMVLTEGKVRGVWANYACHCTTLQGDRNLIHSDWAGLAEDAIEQMHPGSLALITIGCGADSNPFPRGKPENAQAHGTALAEEVARLVQAKGTTLDQNLTCALKAIDLPFDPLPSETDWKIRAEKPGIVGYHAKQNLARLERREKLAATLPYTIQTWHFGDQLGMVFLAGEVVVDYSLRLKLELDEKRLWISSYANQVPCYIPSERILREGGYEAEDSLWYYDQPARLASGLEIAICETAKSLLPRSFRPRSEK